MIPQTNKGAVGDVSLPRNAPTPVVKPKAPSTGGSFFSGHDILDTPLLPIAPEQVRRAALATVEKLSISGASSVEMGDTLAMLGITRQSLSEGLWMGSEGVA